MGYYTRFWGIIKTKPEYVDLINKLSDYETYPNRWIDLVQFYPFVKEYAEHNRSSFVPFGVYASSESVCYIDEYDNFHFDCMLKNYERTIEKFIEVIIPVISETGTFFIQTEDQIEPAQYQITGKEIVKTKEERWEEI